MLMVDSGFSEVPRKTVTDSAGVPIVSDRWNAAARPAGEVPTL
jgi:hypothetical protein